MKILALDVATKTGWAHTDSTGGVWDFSVKRDESGGMRLLRFKGKLKEIFALTTVDIVVYEAARHAAPGMQGALVVQSEMQGVLKEWCECEKLLYKGYSPTEIKKHAIGKGRGSKDVITEAAEKRWPDIEIIDHNHADALWLLDLATKEYGE